MAHKCFDNRGPTVHRLSKLYAHLYPVFIGTYTGSQDLSHKLSSSTSSQQPQHGYHGSNKATPDKLVHGNSIETNIEQASQNHAAVQVESQTRTLKTRTKQLPYTTLVKGCILEL